MKKKLFRKKFQIWWHFLKEKTLPKKVSITFAIYKKGFFPFHLATKNVQNHLIYEIWNSLFCEISPIKKKMAGWDRQENTVWHGFLHASMDIYFGLQSA
jgi:hypothetical protein